ncbi:hypothetical protein POM88_040354 [Heracleum sosnowskyi]|uniref:Uncharacterized protein n=1 Tax=Heracleum sosnowskyi TaxID=360622 RepID=A0AAD8HDY8_9APIA|nr:hypothetical protein POM88_040354 [Heracleum sosnowskyi]
MKSRVLNSSSNKQKTIYHRYLKPGALALIRDSKKFTANFKNPNSQNTLSPSKLINSSLTSIILDTQMIHMAIEGVPFFPALRISQFSKHGQRKKLFAVAPVFADVQS